MKEKNGSLSFIRQPNKMISPTLRQQVHNFNIVRHGCRKLRTSTDLHISFYHSTGHVPGRSNINRPSSTSEVETPNLEFGIWKMDFSDIRPTFPPPFAQLFDLAWSFLTCHLNHIQSKMFCESICQYRFSSVKWEIGESLGWPVFSIEKKKICFIDIWIIISLS